MTVHRFGISKVYSCFQYTVGVTEPIYRSLMIMRVELYRDIHALTAVNPHQLRSSFVGISTVISASRFCNRVTQTRRSHVEDSLMSLAHRYYTEPSTGFSRNFSCFYHQSSKLLCKTSF